MLDTFLIGSHFIEDMETGFQTLRKRNSKAQVLTNICVLKCNICKSHGQGLTGLNILTKQTVLYGVILCL